MSPRKRSRQRWKQPGREANGRSRMDCGSPASRVGFRAQIPGPAIRLSSLHCCAGWKSGFRHSKANAKVGIGVATGNDSVFITKDAHLVEPSRLLKLALVRDICEGTMKWSGHYLVDPWNSDGLIDLDKYPRLQAYFEKHGGL